MLKAKALSNQRFLACSALGRAIRCVPGDPIEAERKSQLVSAVRAHSWEVAETLAMAPSEYEDVADSRLRVAAMDSAIAAGDYARAEALAARRAQHRAGGIAYPPGCADGWPLVRALRAGYVAILVKLP